VGVLEKVTVAYLITIFPQCVQLRTAIVLEN